jgi:hypothetical protein
MFQLSMLFYLGSSLLNTQCIEEVLTFQAKWANSHNAAGNYLGVGLFYYTLVYMAKAQTCVCLGSGGGFVPRIMRQAQRDLQLKNAKTILIDGNMGVFGRPDWISGDTFFRKEFPEIQIIIDTTHNASKILDRSEKINYLHIDADHSLEGVLQDFEDYLPLMARHGIITFHDTGNHLPCSEVIHVLRKRGYPVVNFHNFGAGTAILYLE